MNLKLEEKKRISMMCMANSTVPGAKHLEHGERIMIKQNEHYSHLNILNASLLQYLITNYNK